MAVYGLMAASVVAAADGDPQAGWIAAGAAALVPVLMYLLGFLTRAPGAARTAALTAAAVVAVFMVGSFAVRASQCSGTAPLGQQTQWRSAARASVLPTVSDVVTSGILVGAANKSIDQYRIN